MMNRDKCIQENKGKFINLSRMSMVFTVAIVFSTAAMPRNTPNTVWQTAKKGVSHVFGIKPKTTDTVTEMIDDFSSLDGTDLKSSTDSIVSDFWGGKKNPTYTISHVEWRLEKLSGRVEDFTNNPSRKEAKIIKKEFGALIERIDSLGEVIQADQEVSGLREEIKQKHEEFDSMLAEEMEKRANYEEDSCIGTILNYASKKAEGLISKADSLQIGGPLVKEELNGICGMFMKFMVGIRDLVYQQDQRKGELGLDALEHELLLGELQRIEQEFVEYLAFYYTENGISSKVLHSVVRKYKAKHRKPIVLEQQKSLRYRSEKASKQDVKLSDKNSRKAVRWMKKLTSDLPKRPSLGSLRSSNAVLMTQLQKRLIALDREAISAELLRIMGKLSPTVSKETLADKKLGPTIAKLSIESRYPLRSKL